MSRPEIKQCYCPTHWGQVCYWLTSTTPAGWQVLPAELLKIKLVLFLHGVGGSGRYWFSYLEELAQDENPVIALAPDLLGFGTSDKPDIEYSSDVHLAVIEAVLKDGLSHQLSVTGKPASIEIELELVGHSMGGILALLLADRLVSEETIFQNTGFHLAKLALLGTPYASPKHALEREVLRSPLSRAMLGHPLVCQTVHHSLKLLWPLVLFVIRKGWVKSALPYPVVADYMQHTCQSYTSSAHNVIFETNLDPALKSLQSQRANLLQTLLIYSLVDEEVPWQQGQELSSWFNSCRFELIKQGNHQLLGQLALKTLLPFLV